MIISVVKVSRVDEETNKVFYLVNRKEKTLIWNPRKMGPLPDPDEWLRITVCGFIFKSIKKVVKLHGYNGA